MPNRIQRSRKKGWKKPEGSVCVTRPGKWGNFLKMDGDSKMIFIDASYRRKNLNPWVFLCMGDIHHMLKIYECVVSGTMKPGEYNMPLSSFADLAHWAKVYKEERDLKELKEKDLCCFCKEGEPCHATVLIKLANE